MLVDIIGLMCCVRAEKAGDSINNTAIDHALIVVTWMIVDLLMGVLSTCVDGLLNTICSDE